MTTPAKQDAFQGDLDLFHERLLEFPREAVYRALTDAERLPRWWGRGVSPSYRCPVDQGLAAERG